MTQSDNSVDLRYPVGHFSRAANLTAETREQQIATLRKLPQSVRSAIGGLSDDQLDTPYRDGGWSVRQVVHHVADSHANAYVRTKLALTENWPTIKPYEEADWARLSDSRMPVDASLSLIAALHERWVYLLESLNDDDFARGYAHPVNGRQDLATVVALYAWHSRHHTAHITNLRSRMGW